MDIYVKNALDISEITTKNYSTSFSLGVRSLDKNYRRPIYAIYGFVRFADEIVDTFHNANKSKLIAAFRKDTFEAIENQISTNPILHSFQWVVNNYSIDHHLIDAFLNSMEMDLDQKAYDETKFKEYVYGSAEVVGLMCLRVFYHDDDETYHSLIEPARKLGEAFQKVNFLRDVKADYKERGRVYFPETDWNNFDNTAKKRIEDDIQKDFEAAYEGIRRLKPQVRLGVYLAYIYYLKLFRKIRMTRAENIMKKRYRVPNIIKFYLLLRSVLVNQTGML